MKKNTVLWLCFFASLASLAGVPVKWTVETSRADTQEIDLFHGETLDLEVQFKTYGQILPLPTNEVAMTYWQTNGMGTAYWRTNNVTIVSSNGIMRSNFLASMDVGTKTLRGFMGIAGNIYRASFVLHFKDAPGFEPSIVEWPYRELDFSKIIVTNDLWYRKGEADNMHSNLELKISQRWSELDNKMDKVDASGTNAITSGITAQKVAEYDAYPTRFIGINGGVVDSGRGVGFGSMFDFIYGLNNGFINFKARNGVVFEGNGSNLRSVMIPDGTYVATGKTTENTINNHSNVVHYGRTYFQTASMKENARMNIGAVSAYLEGGLTMRTAIENPYRGNYKIRITSNDVLFSADDVFEITENGMPVVPLFKTLSADRKKWTIGFTQYRYVDIIVDDLLAHWTYSSPVDVEYVDTNLIIEEDKEYDYNKAADSKKLEGFTFEELDARWGNGISTNSAGRGITIQPPTVYYEWNSLDIGKLYTTNTPFNCIGKLNDLFYVNKTLYSHKLYSVYMSGTNIVGTTDHGHFPLSQTTMTATGKALLETDPAKIHVNVASTNSFGGVIVGDGLRVDRNGRISTINTNTMRVVEADYFTITTNNIIQSNKYGGVPGSEFYHYVQYERLGNSISLMSCDPICPISQLAVYDYSPSTWVIYRTTWPYEDWSMGVWVNKNTLMGSYGGQLCAEIVDDERNWGSTYADVYTTNWVDRVSQILDNSVKPDYSIVVTNSATYRLGNSQYWFDYRYEGTNRVIIIGGNPKCGLSKLATMDWTVYYPQEERMCSVYDTDWGTSSPGILLSYVDKTDWGWGGPWCEDVLGNAVSSITVIEGGIETNRIDTVTKILGISGKGGGVDTNTVRRIVDESFQGGTNRVNAKIDGPADSVPDGTFPQKQGTNIVWTVPAVQGMAVMEYMQDENGKLHRVKLVKNKWNEWIPAIEDGFVTNEIVSVEQERIARIQADEQLHTDHTNDVSQLRDKDAYLEVLATGNGPVGRFLSTWDCSTGRPGSEPITNRLEYKAGDYYLVTGVLTNNNLIPSGLVYTNGVPSTTTTTNEVSVNDIYRFSNDNTWLLQHSRSPSTSFGNIAGNPRDNPMLAKELDDAKGGISTNVVQDIIQQNIDTNHVASVAMLDGKRDLTNRTWIAKAFSDWTYDSFAPDDLKEIITNKTLYPNGVLKYNGTMWTCIYGNDPTDAWEFMGMDPDTNPDATAEWIWWRNREDSRSAEGEARRTKLADQVDLVITTDLDDFKTELDAKKRDIKDFTVPEYRIEDYVPWTYMGMPITQVRLRFRTGGGRLIQGQVMGDWYTIMETDSRGRLVVLESDVMFRGGMPQIGDKVVQMGDEIVLKLDAMHDYQTNLIFTATENGKVLGITNNTMQWVEQSGGSSGPTDTLILNGDEDIITGPYVIPHGYGEEGQMLISKGTNAPPEWSDQPMMVLNGTITNAIGPVVIPGGYGQKGQILIGNNNSSPTWLSSGTTGSILVSNGSVANPSWKGTENITFTKSSYVGGTPTITAKRFGNVVTINFQNFYVSEASAGMLLGTINSGKPSGQRGAVLSRTNGAVCLITVDSDGTVKGWNLATGSGASYYGSITYIVD